MKYLTVLAVLFCSAMLSAEVSLPDTPTIGGWCGDFHAAKSFVDAQNVALALVWGRDGCEHCEELAEQLFSTAGSEWAATQRNVVFCWVDGDNSGVDKGKNVGTREFALGTEEPPPPYTPVVRFYWLNRKTLAFSGWSGMMYSKEGGTLLAQFQNSLKKFLDEATPTVPTSACFPMGASECDRLEFVLGKGQGTIDVPVVRSTGTDVVASGKVVVPAYIFGVQIEKEYSFEWKAGEKLAFVKIPLADSDFSGGAVALTLKDSAGQTLATSSIFGVNTVANSEKNPYWLGEKTADGLQWGEWTMDLDVVTNKVNAWNAGHSQSERAYAMILVEGTCWCPDCAMAEANFFNKQDFKDWAKSKKVVFGVVDIPNDPQASDAYPSLLRYDSYKTSDAYVTLRGTVTADESQRYRSGAGYLSRHGIAYADALAVAERNAFLVGHDTLHGGWNEPPTKRKNQNRTGVPVLILLREDGTVAARWNWFSTMGPSAYSDGYLHRFEEMMAQIDDPEEEADDDRSTTRRMISDRDTISSTVSAVDQADFYRIDIPENRTVKFTVTGLGQANLTASVVDAGGTTVASATGLASADGFTLETRLTGSGNFLKIAPEKIEDGQFFSYTKSSSTVCDYSVIAEVGETAGTFGFVVAATNVSENCGEMLIEVSRTKGQYGSASVDVKLIKATGEGIAERIEWTDTTLSWANGETGVKSAVLKVKNDGTMRHDMKLEFGLENLKCVAESGEIGCGRCEINIYDTDYFGMLILKYVAAEDWREIADYRSGDEIGWELKAGELPEGLVLSIADGNVGVTGYAVAEAGEYAAVYSVVLKRGGIEVSRKDLAFEFTVIDYDFSADIPSLKSARNYGNLPLVENGRVCGILTVNVPPDGLLSAKYVTRGGSFAYAAEGWSSLADGRLTAELVQVADPSSCMTVTLFAAGGTVRFDDPVGGGTLEFALDPNAWTEGALPWRGQYTVQLPQTNATDAAGADGSAYMAMRMTSEESVAEGRMLYAGVLPNGRPFYGSSVLLPDGDNAVLPFFHASDTKTAPFVFTGGLAIAKNASETFMTYPWNVAAKWTPEWEVPDAFGLTADFNVYGGYYDEDRIWDLFQRDFTEAERSTFCFMVGTDSLVSERHGQGTGSIAVRAEMTSTNMPKLVDGAANPQEVEFEFVPEVGVIRGAFLIPFEDADLAVTYRGIALPGWQGCMACSIGGDAVERPWAVGACSFSDRLGKTTFRNGCEVILGKRK